MKRYPSPTGIFPATIIANSVGNCGVNDPKDVKKLQKSLIDAGYILATGRTLNVDGICGAELINAIQWVQNLINMPANGMVSPFTLAFFEALSNIDTQWQPSYKPGNLNVSIGQYTFDNEGQDIYFIPLRAKRMKYFSRILHHPDQNSGVTIGRGFDMKKRSVGNIYNAMRIAGIPEYKCVICSKASGLYGREADQFVSVFRNMVGEITHQQQISLFENAYREIVNYASGVYSRAVSKESAALPWDKLDRKIRDVFVDTLYQGNSTAWELSRAAMKNDIPAVIEYFRNDPTCIQYESSRQRIRYLNEA
ncbi:peptidoglycan-binding protein [Kosakonia oryzendophytica]|uniref:peptidoglycan-binding protein n=1 Tax=Kosakonia oryzendophytica TaxID=1005665 RepID=UPI003D336DE2